MPATPVVRRVSHMTLIVTDQDAAIAFYAKAFGTEIRGDNEFEMGGQAMRFVTVGIPGDDLEISLQLPMAMPGHEPPKAGDNNMTVVAVDDADAACAQCMAAGATVVSGPEDLPWGRSAVIRDPDGNPWNLVRANQ